MKIYCYNIKYTDRERILHVTGYDALKNFIDNGTIPSYDSTSAPDELVIDVNLDACTIIDDLYYSEQYIKKCLSEEAGLTVKTFNYRFLND